HHQEVGERAGDDLAEAVFLVEEFRGGGRGGAEDVGGGDDGAADGEFPQLVSAHAAEEVGAVADVDAGPVGEFEGVESGVEDDGVLGDAGGGEAVFGAFGGHALVGDQGGDQERVVLEEQVHTGFVEEVAV
ncbi:hypothetical protein ADL26_15165, partial [Thermoactinomyces vulgaris]